ncbi:MTH1187/YkoF-like protein [Trametes coccinea BRFM310]|uniref:MTH1187/YkoF-like protein n=1 Tax=Trametes coccinea (strain BRFM310) TaxID=1353009 RepID=A0A1Y2J4Y6_TRAC3|nr:MTH1187/YkoF-like protein [Trametes coccinea BRFM310]
MSSTSNSSSDLYAVADFCLVPMGTGEPSVADGYGTNLEGPWTEVMQAIHACHAAVHAKGAPRIATDIRIGTRVDREIAPGTGNEGKVKRVEEILARDQSASTQ